ncbi:hypothetical protein [Plantactinospora sp. GCM10030261]|uniref:hypothetical protein n=1 Tax=Plantactinospora sp. GCM10030261 TaxID=3273420 RepID=UPI00361675F0
MSTSEEGASRRAMLRTAAVAGGAALAATTTVTAVTAAPAAAADGDPVKLAQLNDGTSTTTLRAAAGDGATLSVANPDGATLRLSRGSVVSAVPGALHPTVDGLSVVGTDAQGNARRHSLLTTASASMPVPIAPTRVLDTRTSAGRAHLVEGAGDIDRYGRAVADSFMVVSLRHLVEYGYGVLANITVASTVTGGFGKVWVGPYPEASTINWWTGGQILSNAVISPLGWYDKNGVIYQDIIAISVSSPAAVIFDVTGFLVSSPFDITAAGATAAGAGRKGRTGARRGAPEKRDGKLRVRRNG